MRVGMILPFAAVVLATPAGSGAAAPADRADPCAKAGRDICGTTGVGAYRDSRYGIRWFGDYRGVVPGEQHAFCIDLRYWYASPKYRYRPSAKPLVNRDGERVPAARQARLAYAVWQYGRSTQPRRQAAVMLYVHSQMGDARPGELDAKPLGAPVAALKRRIAADAARFAGPYRIETQLPAAMVVGRAATATLSVRAASGRAVPNVRLTVAASGVTAPAQIRTDASGLVRVQLTPTAADLQLQLSTEPLPASRPRILVPTRADAAANGQRLAVPTAERVAATVAGHAKPVVTAEILRTVVRPGTPLREHVRVDGFPGRPTTVEIAVYGPFPSRRRVVCGGRPRSRTTMTVGGGGTAVSTGIAVRRPGFYTTRVRLLGSPALPSDCATAETTSLVVPRVVAGGRETAPPAAVAGAAGATPVRVRVPSLEIDAPVVPTGIDLEQGVLGLPSRIGRAGWWRDGAAPGAAHGTTLIAGHVDRKDAGPGAFFPLRNARAGMVVRVATADGRSHAYRVRSVRLYTKQSLPLGVWSTSGPARLVLVTCGGAFDEATGHYADNVVVTASPVVP